MTLPGFLPLICYTVDYHGQNIVAHPIQALTVIQTRLNRLLVNTLLRIKQSNKTKVIRITRWIKLDYQDEWMDNKKHG